MSESPSQVRSTTLLSLASGGLAGVTVDVVLFPLDTIKTRLQSSQGFFKAGGFNGVYRGLLSAATGSAPAASAFFGTYETVKQLLLPQLDPSYHFVAFMSAAVCGESVAACVRVPFEVVKQNMQANNHSSTAACVRHIHSKFGMTGFFRGLQSLIMREIPFSLIQFPIYESLKSRVRRDEPNPPAWKMSLCGSIAGSISAGLTTPLDVVKTRIMLNQEPATDSVLAILRRILHNEGVRALYAGIGPRCAWIGLGGAVFFGAYEESRVMLSKYTPFK